MNRPPMRLRYMLCVLALTAGASLADPLPSPVAMLETARHRPAQACERGDLSVMTYNVAGLPWPLAKKGPEALRAIGERLARMRAAGCAPAVVVLQEAFTAEARDIGRRAGYAFVVDGPYLRTGAAAPGIERDWTLGETAGTPVDSGLVVLSDLPVLDISRAAFPEGACAGYDCLAAKGVVLVTLQLANGRTVMVADTHFNSRGASGASPARSLAAYRRQADFLARFVARNRPADMPVVIAGDFNQGKRPERAVALQSALGRLAGHPLPDALRTCITGNTAHPADARAIVGRAKDMQFVLPGRAAGLIPTGSEVPFGTEPDGSMLSDHMGYTIHYRYSAS